MKPTSMLVISVLLAAAGIGGWWVGRSSAPLPGHDHDPASGERRIAFYQSSMHPWIKSDQPGNCTICGMALAPVFEGQQGFAAEAGVVTLGSNSIQVIHVRTDTVRRAPLRRTLRFAGTIEDDDTRHRFLAAYVDGRIDGLFVNFEGAEVTAGQPLARLYSPLLLTAKREYLALKEQAGAGEDARRLLAASAQRLRQLGLMEPQLESLTALSLTNIHTELLAPVTGTVVKRFVYEGQYVKEGDMLFELADFSTMWLQFDAYEQDLPWLQIGREVSVTTPSVPGRTFTGQIKFIDPNVREMSRSVRVRVELPNPLEQVGDTWRRPLLHRIFAEARVAVESAPVLAVPRSAVLMPGGQAVVYVDQGGGAYEQRLVQLGRRGDHHWEVLAGLAEGENVVTQGNLMIDAQAQLNSGAGPAHDHGTEQGTATDVVEPLSALDESQRAVLGELFVAADRLGAALASDDLPAYNNATQPLHSLLPKVAASLASAQGWFTLASRLNQSGHLTEAVDLEAARKAFHRFVTPVTELAVELKRNHPETGVHIFQCPMTARSFDGAPARARWVQLKPEIRNPYYGAAMLDCGAEVKIQ
jgi:membrane fusion protein, copper/silver efflux system